MKQPPGALGSAPAPFGGCTLGCCSWGSRRLRVFFFPGGEGREREKREREEKKEVFLLLVSFSFCSVAQLMLPLVRSFLPLFLFHSHFHSLYLTHRETESIIEKTTAYLCEETRDTESGRTRERATTCFLFQSLSSPSLFFSFSLAARSRALCWCSCRGSSSSRFCFLCAYRATKRERNNKKRENDAFSPSPF